MNESMKAFLDAIQNNEELKEKVIEIDKKEQEEEPEERLEEYISVAKEYGITLTKEDFLPEQPDTSEMSDEELQAVAGGEEDNALICGLVGKTTPGDQSGCFCILGGGGKGKGVCGCAFCGLMK